jgi:GT2 family glycosyltransferase
MLVCNRAEVTLGCLQTLALRLNSVPFEIIVVDNGSSDETAQLLDRVQGVKVLRNAANVGFPAGVNQASRLATGEFLLLLNNDTQVLGKSIDMAAGFLSSHPDVGAVGGRVVLLDGTLQEGGCLIRQDGFAFQQGRGEDPFHPAFAFQYEVDYCSGVFLMTRRELFRRLGGLDEAFGPGYFEDTDYCVRLHKAGYRIVYIPDSLVIHYENATSSGMCDVPALFRRNHQRFAARHADWLLTQPNQHWPAWAGRMANRDSFKVLVFGDGFAVNSAPEQAWRALTALLSRIESLDGFVTLCLTGAAAEAMRPMLPGLSKTIELLCVQDLGEVRQLLQDRVVGYDLVLHSDSDERMPIGLPWLSSIARAVWRDGEFRLVGKGPCTTRKVNPKVDRTVDSSRTPEAA